MTINANAPIGDRPAAGDVLPRSAAALVPILFGHAAFQQLNASCELGLHELLHDHPGLGMETIADRLKLTARSVRILLIGTTALDLTDCTDGRYANAPVIEEMFRNDSWSIFRDLVKFEANIAYPSHSDFVESLRT